MIKKETLLRFINKYTLGDTIKSVNWKTVIAEKALKSRGELEAKTFIMDVTLTGFEEFSEDVRIPIASTQKVKALLSPFEDEISISLNKVNDRILGFTISDKDCESYCSAADPSAIPPVTKDLTDKHVYEIEVDLTEEFVDKLLKARMALDEVGEFTVKMNKNDKVEFVVGYSVANTNRISIIAPTVNGKDKFEGTPLKFPVRNIVEVLRANKEIEGGKLFVKAGGVLKMVYKNEQFQCTYWQFAQIKK